MPLKKIPKGFYTDNSLIHNSSLKVSTKELELIRKYTEKFGHVSISNFLRDCIVCKIDTYQKGREYKGGRLKMRPYPV